MAPQYRNHNRLQIAAIIQATSLKILLNKPAHIPRNVNKVTIIKQVMSIQFIKAQFSINREVDAATIIPVINPTARYK